MTSRMLGLAAGTLLLSSWVVRADALSDVAGRYEIEHSSNISFSVSQITGGAITGSFEQFSGTFLLNPSDVSRSRVVFTLRPASVVSGQARVENFLRSSAVFDSTDYPAITFRSIRVVPISTETARIDGILSARGNSHEETFKATLVRHRGRDIVFRVVGDVFRSRYGMDVGTPIYSNVAHFDMVVRGHRS